MSAPSRTVVKKKREKKAKIDEPGSRASAGRGIRKGPAAASSAGGALPPVADQVRATLASLKKLGSAHTRDEMGPRYGISLPDPKKAFGVGMAAMQRIAKGLRPNHELALALWETGWYEARMVASMIDDPARVTSAQMDGWCRDFDNWGICDTVCFKLFDRVPPELAFRKIAQWCGRKEEFIRRAGFALLACMALHNKAADDAAFVKCLPLIERGAKDERNFVKKGVSWGLRGVGHRSPALRPAAVTLAQRLAQSESAAERWVGKDALKDLTR